MDRNQRNQILEKAKKWGQKRHPRSPMQRHAAFANSVVYLVTGSSGGYGRPSIREHAVSWALAGDGFNALVSTTNLGDLTIQFPDGRIPRPGQWDFDRACQFADPIVYGPLPAIASRIVQQEYCFDDDPDDLADLKLLGK